MANASRIAKLEALLARINTRKNEPRPPKKVAQVLHSQAVPAGTVVNPRNNPAGTENTTAPPGTSPKTPVGGPPTTANTASAGNPGNPGNANPTNAANNPTGTAPPSTAGRSAAVTKGRAPTVFGIPSPIVSPAQTSQPAGQNAPHTSEPPSPVPQPVLMGPPVHRVANPISDIPRTGEPPKKITQEIVLPKSPSIGPPPSTAKSQVQEDSSWDDLASLPKENNQDLPDLRYPATTGNKQGGFVTSDGEGEEADIPSSKLSRQPAPVEPVPIDLRTDGDEMVIDRQPLAAAVNAKALAQREVNVPSSSASEGYAGVDHWASPRLPNTEVKVVPLAKPSGVSFRSVLERSLALRLK